MLGSICTLKLANHLCRIKLDLLDRLEEATSLHARSASLLWAAAVAEDRDAFQDSSGRVIECQRGYEAAKASYEGHCRTHGC